jgi:hypothetical protein
MFTLLVGDIRGQADKMGKGDSALFLNDTKLRTAEMGSIFSSITIKSTTHKVS